MNKQNEKRLPQLRKEANKAMSQRLAGRGPCTAWQGTVQEGLPKELASETCRTELIPMLESAHVALL